MPNNPKRSKGRPRKPDNEKLKERLYVQLTPDEKEKAMKLGGSQWVRERIRKAVIE